jgi:alanine dehydrogenase
MHKERGEVRDFLPEFVAALDRSGAESIVLEQGYGAGMGVGRNEYLESATSIRFGSHSECLAQDVVIVVRCPDDGSLQTMKRGATLVSMLHFPTRPDRVTLLDQLGLSALSLDSLTDDEGNRLVQNMEAVAWNGMDAAFGELADIRNDFYDPGRAPLSVTILGSGAVGTHAVHAATRYGNVSRRAHQVDRGVSGVEVTVVDFDLTGNEAYMLDRLAATDLLVDATQRPDPALVVIPNRWLAALPETAVVLDLAADPYEPLGEPAVVKGIEGIPQGDLDRWVFYPDDPVYDRLPKVVDTTVRRVAVSCFSWPGRTPKSCMEIYGEQLEPLLKPMLTLPPDKWDPSSDDAGERALTRAEMSGWLKATRN